MSKKVAVTGLGIVSSIGIGREEFWDNLIKGKSGISRVELFDTSPFSRHLAGEIKNFHPEKFILPGMLKFFGRASQFAIAAAILALADAKIALPELRKKKAAVIIGTTMTEADVIDFAGEAFIKEEWDKITPALLVNTFSPSIARNLGHFLKIKGRNLLIPNACAAGNYALGYGFDLLESGEADLVIVGGADALSRVAFQGFQRLYAMAPEVCAPFDKERKGMLLGEGAGMLILEREDAAKERGVPGYAKVLGYGFSCDAYNMTIPHRAGIKKAMAKALKNAGVSIGGLDYINAHGTGTLQNDKAEAGAIQELSAGLKKIPVSSLKSMLGHCMGAASSIESAACCLALKEGIIPPTINFKTPDPDCDIDCVPNEARQAKLKIVLKNGFAFGGNNCCLVFGD